jgi:cysteinyl-tRNA synthetase
MRMIFISITFVILSVACNNTENSKAATHDEPMTHADSLMKDVLHGHDFAMGKMSKLSAAQKHVHQVLDSINKLAGKLRNASAGYKTQLDSLTEKLKYAENGMNKWMEEFNYDSATNGANRTRYLESENLKISTVKAAMLSALQKADSLLGK